MTDDLTDLRQHLKEFVEKRRHVENVLGTNPSNRAELESLVVRMLDHEEYQRDIIRELEFYDKVAPLMQEAMEALGAGDQTTIDDAMKWHAARGNEFAKAYLKHVNGFEHRQRSDEVEAAMKWHPAWHECDDRSWKCATPDNPEVWETDKLLAQYRRHLASHREQAP